ncbi:kinesin-like protein KIN-UC [Dioscorea cayenensis subsp. rotundata]|uniref:Protein ARMADILLO REPEAT KINESIN1 n=1 Tax=Dioscorea cayennensis subsp. rotundata TaxID=55577 RepID=A0AB40CSC6_DIOCR|nr:kinesin-like protein KIN-UC [Dioscorea cayenensis subsp. rotundata]
MASARASLRGDRPIPVAVRAGGHTVRSRPSTVKRSVAQSLRASLDDDEESGRVRVAVRLRPKNADDLLWESDFTDSVELQPELRRLKLRKNNWISESYRFDEVFTETASQKRVYEAVAKPVVESVLNGYNGTVMAYGQTGTGKTFTLGQLGKNDASQRGIIVRALEDILADVSPAFDTVSVSYVQLYLESVQDLLAPEKINIPIVEDPKTGEVSLPGLAIVEIRNLGQFIELLQIGEANRHAANTKLNTESSRSHAILMVHVQRSSKIKDETEVSQGNDTDRSISSQHVSMILKSKLLMVDLAGSERIDKSGSEGHMLEEAKFINLSLTSLGKCINALAENSPHIPTRDSKLTRLLRDSFGGTARTSLVITVGPSARHYSETASTIAFGQRAMKVVNTIKLKEEIDYDRLCRKLESQVDSLTSEVERLQKLRDDEKEEMEKQLKNCETHLAEAENQLDIFQLEVDRQKKLRDDDKEQMEKKLKDYEALLSEAEDQVELLKSQINEQKKLRDAERDLMEIKLKELNTLSEAETNFANKYECLEKEKSQLHVEIKKLMEELNTQKGRNDLMSGEIFRLEMCLKQEKQHQLKNASYQKVQADTTQMYENKVAELIKKLEDEHSLAISLEKELNTVTQKLSNNERALMMLQNDFEELTLNLDKISTLNKEATIEVQSLRLENKKLASEKEYLNKELITSQEKLSNGEMKRKCLQDELAQVKKLLPYDTMGPEAKMQYLSDSLNRDTSTLTASMNLSKSNKPRETLSSQKAKISKIFDEVGLSNVLTLLKSEDLNVQIHAVKVVANLAAEDSNQERIVEEGGLDALLMLLESSQDATIHRVTAGAIANLAMSGSNQDLIMRKGGARLLANIGSRTDDPQTLRMVAGAIANLCGNEKLHTMLKEDGGTKALMGMVRCGHSDVIAQIARGIANFAKCESRGISQGHRKGRSLLIDDGALTWMVEKSTAFSTSTRRHIELALCHLAQNEANTIDVISSGGIKELVRISQESSREDIRNLSKKALHSNPVFLVEMRKL